jgi:DNA-binding SARP family transcriptional activator
MTALPITVAPDYAPTAPKIRVLGPLEVTGSTAPTAPMIRQLLAVLARFAQRRVSLVDLATELWGEEHTQSIPSIQTFVMFLRKVPGIWIDTRHRGYALMSAAPMDVDALRFTSLVSQAAAEYKAGGLHAARDTLLAGLSLWRGQALEDVERGRLLSGWAVDLEDSRRTARALRFEIDLRFGLHRDILDELRAAWRANPAEEPTAGLLMLALYRSDRRVAALDIYRDTRAALLDGYGLDPGPGLARLQQQILSGDPALELNGEH